MAITITRDGYGQLEPNHLSAPRNGQVYGQLPAAEGIDILEQGMFVKYDYAAGEMNFKGEGPWMLVFNEEKLYDERFQMHKHFALKREDFYDGQLYSRVMAVVPGDLFTTNMFAEGAELAQGDKLMVGADGILCKGEAPAGQHAFKVVKEYTMPDGQPAVKVQVIA
jgi:hypothetical protein